MGRGEGQGPIIERSALFSYDEFDPWGAQTKGWVHGLHVVVRFITVCNSPFCHVILSLVQDYYVSFHSLLEDSFFG